MSTTFTPEVLNRYTATQPTFGEPYLRVGLDTGGIAAGARLVYQYFDDESEKLDRMPPVSRVGSNGLSWADPIVEVNVANMPPTLYGAVDVDVAKRILDEHILGGRLVDDHMLTYPDTAQARAALLKPNDLRFILVKDTSCEDNDRTEFFQFTLQEELKRRKLAERVQVVRALDVGVYDEGVVVRVFPAGITYSNVLTDQVAQIVERSVEHDDVIENLRYDAPVLQERVVMRNCGIIDPEDLDDYVSHGGYQGLNRALAGSPQACIAEIKESGLRGRGGAGFPTWLKWDLTRKVAADVKYVICNADEGDPGAFMDRSVLEGDPHAVLEGLMLAAYSIGASMGYFYIRAEYPMAIERIQKAIVAARQAGLLGKDILGRGFSFDAKVRLGAGAFVCGEETALIASIEGKRGSPSPRPPYPSVSGLWGKPTSINNVETLAAASAVLAKGGAWYAGIGTKESTGTKVFAVTGKIRNAQLVEVPMGTKLRDIVFKICGGMHDRNDIKAIQTGGPSGGVIPEKLLDTGVSYEALKALGSIMGSGGMLVMDQTDCMVDVAKFYLKFCVDESCGKCAPCRVGGYQLLQLLEKIARGSGKPADVAMLRRICVAMQKASLCGLGQTAPNPVLSTLKYFENEYNAYIEGGHPYARKMKKARAAGPITATVAATA
ncbi:NADH-ubiquinone oxidoreductase-F iron-sulfur binding region domain-containing protein [Synoicihabitans lomoniglobus]|uniref:NADH-ubiquinone oxidoreductase-F iron-sulfur binding region domain-containing protein n=1 Tax=Synoicihabitans lomoniglobus TaxID=2909285 RepID=A0AAF0CR85_9BACT|nr:NADH-ubiquinone oxidoreductase-F iron-sulfur binding region domain-containing protein [Opitutaceae bacterium LMO-M01]